jgi:hypothetical protein
MGKEAQVTEAGDYRFFAGWRSDPFFFDPLGALNNLQFEGHDFFADKDVCSIVICWRLFHIWEYRTGCEVGVNSSAGDVRLSVVNPTWDSRGISA